MKRTEEVSERIRTCLGCRRQLPQGEFLRIIRGPDGVLVPDLKKRLPGRGGYACFDRQCLQEALSPTRLRRAFRGESTESISVDAFVEQLLLQLKESVKNLLGMACKARKAVFGKTEVREALESGLLRFVAVASDCEQSRRQEMTDRCEKRTVPYLAALSVADLGQISGRGVMDFVGIIDRGFAEQMIVLGDRLRRLDLLERRPDALPVSTGSRKSRSREGR